MPVFAAIAAILTIGVLAAVLWPLWRGSRPVFIGAVLALCVGALALYRLLGTPAAIDAPPPVAQMPDSMEEAVRELEETLARNPNEIEGWRLLGRSYLKLERYPEARDAFARALALAPGDVDVMVEAAQAHLYAARDPKLFAEGVALLQRVLQAQPDHQRARWFLGVAQRQQGQAAEAARTWEPLLAQVTGNTATALLTQINDARSEAGLPPLTAPATTTAPASPAATASALLRVRIELAPELKARLTGNETLFVFARQAGGPPMPVAAKRLPVGDFPMTIELGDGDSPMPTLKLSQVPNVELAARISKAGDVMPKTGDLEAPAVAATPGDAKDHTLRIERVVP